MKTYRRPALCNTPVQHAEESGVNRPEPQSRTGFPKEAFLKKYSQKLVREFQNSIRILRQLRLYITLNGHLVRSKEDDAADVESAAGVTASA